MNSNWCRKVNSRQQKAIEIGMKEAKKNKNRQLKKLSSSSLNQAIYISEPVKTYITDLDCNAYHLQPQICTSLPNCGYCTKSQHCINADSYGVGVVEVCPSNYYIYDSAWWSDPLMVNYDPFSYSVVPLYSSYYDLGSPLSSNVFYPAVSSFLYRLKKKSLRKKTNQVQ